MKRMFVAGNWKMHTDMSSGMSLIEAILAGLPPAVPGVAVAVCPPFTLLDRAAARLAATPVLLGAQHVHERPEGAYTGEISATMLRSVGCTHAIVGHSERRQYFGETDEGVHRKIAAALEAGLTPIVCVGETLEERDAGRAMEVVSRQVRAALEGITAPTELTPIVAYEPVWAIGTGRTATPAQAQEAHALIRRTLGEVLPKDTAASIPLIYGGSVKPENAPELFAQPDIHGGLIGGASLRAADFLAIVRAAS